MSMPKKRLLQPDRVRQIPEQFSWIDRGLVRRRLIDGLSTEAIALYFFLITVSDRLGLSFYSERRLCELLSMNMERLTWARNELVREDLIAWSYPLYQVLALPVSPNSPPASELPRGHGMQAFAQVLGQLGQSIQNLTPPAAKSEGGDDDTR